MKSLILIIILAFLPVFNLASQSPLIEVRGKVVDEQTGRALPYCNISVEGSNVATVTNNEGEFSLKLPSEEARFTIRFLGYMERTLSVRELSQLNGLVQLPQVVYQLPQIDVLTQDGANLVAAMLDRVGDNYSQNELLMTAFYRESIQRGRRYVSLAEAVIDVQKHPYTSYRNDAARIYKARKQTDYTRLDTLVFKLMGGPYNSLLLDVMKNPNIIFSENVFGNYRFHFTQVDYLDERLVYVVEFKPAPYIVEPLYYGTLYIDAENLALKSAVFSLDLTNKDEAVKYFIRKKPFNAVVVPVQADYRIDYIEQDGKWYYGYSRIELGMRVNWRRKLFHTYYNSTIEMAVTDREYSSETKATRFRDRLRSDVIISDAAGGFSDPDFWGPYNVIEPDKPIEAAIRKIIRDEERK